MAWARIALTLVLILVGWTAFRDPYGGVPLLGGIDLAIHEFGHVLFMPFGIPIFGETMVILGGSLFQVAFPLIFTGYFLHARNGRRDVHAAMVCLWWAAINLLNVAIYCDDARAGVLMLVNGQTGQESDGHDWHNLLAQWGALNRDHVIANHMRRTAWLIFLVSVAIGLYAAWNSDSPRAVDEPAGEPSVAA